MHRLRRPPEGVRCRRAYRQWLLDELDERRRRAGGRGAAPPAVGSASQDCVPQRLIFMPHRCCVERCSPKANIYAAPMLRGALHRAILGTTLLDLMTSFASERSVLVCRDGSNGLVVCTPVRRYLTVPAMVSCAGDPANAGVVPPLPRDNSSHADLPDRPRSLVVLMLGGWVGMTNDAREATMPQRQSGRHAEHTHACAWLPSLSLGIKCRSSLLP